MADDKLQVTGSDSVVKQVDGDSLTVGATTVFRERDRIAGGAAAELADVRNAAPGASDYGLVGRVGDGHNVVEGTTTDAAVTTDVNGTLSAKLRGLVKMFADVWDSVNHRFNVAVGSVVPGTGATNLGKAEDSPAADGDVGVMALTVRQDVIGSMVGASGDYQAITTDLQGRVRSTDDISATVLREMLTSILIEMRVQTTILHTTLNCRDDVDALRNDAMQQGRVVNEAN